MGDGSEIRSQVEAYRDVSMEGLLLQKAEHLLQQLVEVDGLNLDIHALGEPEESVSDFPAAVNRPQNGVHLRHQLLPILIFFGKLHQVFHQPGFFVDDSQWIIDFMGHPGGKPTQGGQLAGVFHLCIH